MSVEINVGDTIQFNNVEYSLLNHKMYDSTEFYFVTFLATAPIIAEVVTVHTNGAFGDGYLILRKTDQIYSRDNQTYLVNLHTLLISEDTRLNGVEVPPTEDYPNKWAEFADNDNRKAPEAFTSVSYGYTAFPKYEQLIKKFLPLRKRIYLWACTIRRNLIG